MNDDNRLKPGLPQKWISYLCANVTVAIFWLFLWPRFAPAIRFVAAPSTLAAVNLAFWWSFRLRDSAQRLGAKAEAKRALWLGVSLIILSALEIALSIFDFFSRNVIGADALFALVLLFMGALMVAQAKRKTPGDPVSEGEPETPSGKTGSA